MIHASQYSLRSHSITCSYTYMVRVVVGMELYGTMPFDYCNNGACALVEKTMTFAPRSWRSVDLERGFWIGYGSPQIFRGRFISKKKRAKNAETIAATVEMLATIVITTLKLAKIGSSLHSVDCN